MSRIVLASRSPRRQELLHRMGIDDFTVIVPDVCEDCPAGLSPEETVLYISGIKSDAAYALCEPDDLIITADTMVFLKDERLGKPGDEAEALRMLETLAGNRHTVCTGVTLRRGEQRERFAASTDVYFRSASRSELLAYIKSGEPMDKAGAYGVQGLGSLLVERIEGDFYNVMGLPVEALGCALKRFGIRLLG